MIQGKVEICGVNTAKLPVLKEEEKDALFARIKQGDAAIPPHAENISTVISASF